MTEYIWHPMWEKAKAEARRRPSTAELWLAEAAAEAAATEEGQQAAAEAKAAEAAYRRAFRAHGDPTRARDRWIVEVDTPGKQRLTRRYYEDEWAAAAARVRARELHPTATVRMFKMEGKQRA